MATKAKSVPDETAVVPDMDLVTTAPDDWQFETVAEESPTKVIFDTVGDVFIGQYQGRITITPEKDDPFDLYLFRGRDGILYGLNTSYSLDTAITKESKVSMNDWVRITLIKEIDSGKGNPMKDFRVEVRRS